MVELVSDQTLCDIVLLFKPYSQKLRQGPLSLPSGRARNSQQIARHRGDLRWHTIEENTGFPFISFERYASNHIARMRRTKRSWAIFGMIYLERIQPGRDIFTREAHVLQRQKLDHGALCR
jgi:hypothetical protein